MHLTVYSFHCLTVILQICSACLWQRLSLISQQTFVLSATNCRGLPSTLHSLQKKMQELSPKFLMTVSAFCQQLIPCLAGSLNLARISRNLNSWGCWWYCHWCAYVSLGCTTTFKATEMQLCVSRLMMPAVHIVPVLHTSCNCCAGLWDTKFAISDAWLQRAVLRCMWCELNSVKYSDSLCVYCNTQFAIRFGTVSNRGI